MPRACSVGYLVGSLIRDTFLRATRGAEAGCYPTDAPTGRVMCFSDGVLVYMTQTYRNGGALCTNDGIELKLPKDLCIEESRQGDAWSPPQAAERIDQ